MSPPKLVGDYAERALVAGDTPDKPLRVLQSLRVVRPTTNPYLVMLNQRLRETPGLELLNFSYRTALLRSYEVFHVHWPEILLRGSTRLRTAVRQVLLVLVLLKLRLARVGVVRTVHNLHRPEGLRPHEHWLLEALDRLTVVCIHLNDHTPTRRHTTPVLIPHGHYRDWFANHLSSQARAGQFGYVGLIRRYKGVEGLLTAFRETSGHKSGPSLSLHVGGKPSTKEMADALVAIAAADDRIHLQLEFLSDADLVRIVTSSELTVLPYRHMHNSGGALAVLSLGRPVLVPDNVVNRALREEVGWDWVHVFAGELTAEDLMSTLLRVRNRNGGLPDLTARNWDQVGAKHRDAYAQAVSRRRGAS
jgi:beta-1,4-mannosyltransferase